ncbi:hydrogenase expression/formation protein HypE [Leptolyngbya sp. BL0902]|uniref:hydrogenase expression/formation protein HypE n=1 Tax=Leptolyngbya sp. BL0902 TaxID=1115757 RepID=UPI0018E72D7C|nr:hydrogenase expression/formation protein HypE [Leptolyngbya sp. BL0902]QQE67292.1 hydrogenase expression/formation protein HypE [Leptolyngbya sp. BL0902]
MGLAKTRRETCITLAHGSGGKAMADLVAEVFVHRFDNALLAPLNDQAVMDWAGGRLALTTDSYVVDPLFFPGSDIGALAVNGTVNDLAVGGATPLYLTCGFILEEGLPMDTLRRVVESMAQAAAAAGVQIVTGDTKVVPRGSADKLFINTAGVGRVPEGIAPSADRLRPGDVVLVNGFLGDHGAAITVARADLALESPIESDCQPLNGLVSEILKVCPQVRAMRDATRGGLATVMNEFALSSQVGIRLQENALPVRPAVQGLCELLGLDPLYLANEGKLVVVVPPDQAEAVLAAMCAHPAGTDSHIIGEVVADPVGFVLLKTAFGSDRILDRLVGDQLPRIC